MEAQRYWTTCPVSHRQWVAELLQSLCLSSPSCAPHGNLAGNEARGTGTPEYVGRSCRPIKGYVESSKYNGKPLEGFEEGMTGSDSSF